MSVSLLARQMSFLALIAATVGIRPAQPTMPVTTDCEVMAAGMQACRHGSMRGNDSMAAGMRRAAHEDKGGCVG
jgi:hypothetical protein